MLGLLRVRPLQRHARLARMTAITLTRRDPTKNRSVPLPPRKRLNGLLIGTEALGRNVATREPVKPRQPALAAAFSECSAIWLVYSSAL